MRSKGFAGEQLVVIVSIGMDLVERIAFIMVGLIVIVVVVVAPLLSVMSLNP